MAEHPILFSGPMVRAILEGRKTQTRRVMKVQMEYDGGSYWQDGTGALHLIETLCPYGVPGDRLWVRETWGIFDQHHDGLAIAYRADDIGDDLGAVTWFDVDMETHHKYCLRDGVEKADEKWRPSIFMPRWASRINLEITGVRVERLQDIGKDGRKAHDVLAEGISREAIEQWEQYLHKDDAPAHTYGVLWDTINGKRAPWASNPWVWVVEFKRVAP